MRGTLTESRVSWKSLDTGQSKGIYFCHMITGILLMTIQIKAIPKTTASRSMMNGW